MGPEAQPFGLCRPSFVRPHSVRVWSCQRTTRMHRLYRRWGELGEGGGRMGGEVCGLCVHHPVQTLPAGGYGFPASHFHPSRSWTSWKRRCPWQQLIWPHFLQGEPGLFLKLHLSIIQLGKENIQQGLMKACHTPVTQQPFFNILQLHFRFHFRPHFTVQEIINGPNHWSFLFQCW